MIVLHSISMLALIAMLVYVICFICRYRIIPQSLSVTAEYNGRYRWWKWTICLVMGWLSYYFPTVYPYSEYGLYPLLASLGVAGLSLAGYYSYSPDKEDRELLLIHKIGSFAGACFLTVFFSAGLHESWIFIVLAFCSMLGVYITGKRYGYPENISIIFWNELGIIGIVGYNIIINFIEAL